jgi:hypothetical protein
LIATNNPGNAAADGFIPNRSRCEQREDFEIAALDCLRLLLEMQIQQFLSNPVA